MRCHLPRQTPREPTGGGRPKMTLLMLLVGFAGLVLGGELLVRGAVAIALRFGLSQLMIGLTLVGFGTSTPELVTSLQAAFKGSPGIAVGNVVGSNICNVLLILGAAAADRDAAGRLPPRWHGPAWRDAALRRRRAGRHDRTPRWRRPAGASDRLCDHDLACRAWREPLRRRCGCAAPRLSRDLGLGCILHWRASAHHFRCTPSG